jgi:hypothetical protein
VRISFGNTNTPAIGTLWVDHRIPLAEPKKTRIANKYKKEPWIIFKDGIV